MEDPTEYVRRLEQAAINSGAVQPEGQTWTTDQLTADFDVIGYAAPYVIVRRKADGKQGSLKFRHSPRIYFDWSESR